MRDSILAIMIVAAGYGVYRYSNITSIKVLMQNEVKRFSVPSPVKGDTAHGKSKSDLSRAAVENSRQGEGASGESSASEGLPSIYRKKGRRAKPAPIAKVEGEEPAPSKEQKVVYGVPVEDWAEAQTDRLTPPVAEDPNGIGIRVYLQCMELKKRGPEYLAEKECDSLLAKRGLPYGGRLTRAQ